jgi:hypothetical protein
MLVFPMLSMILEAIATEYEITGEFNNAYQTMGLYGKRHALKGLD